MAFDENLAERSQEAFLEPHARPFDITGRAMKNWVLAKPKGIEDDDQLKGWGEAGRPRKNPRSCSDRGSADRRYRHGRRTRG